ncbi:MAG TPA: hypothetical protein VI300_12770 [Solirubrobacter sp.]
MSGKSLVQWIAVLSALGALTAYALRPANKPVAQAATASGGLTFAPDFPAADRAWVLAAIANARPEARQLIDDVDGRTRITAFYEPYGYWLGWAQTVAPNRYEVRLNLARLDGRRKIDRDTVTLHELGHVVDFALVPDTLRDQLAAHVPTSGACPDGIQGDCAAAPERFADTFAKWALRGAVSAVGAGYSLASPRSLEDWGAPLSELAIELNVAARR